jgi:serine/threonine-protein kinase
MATVFLARALDQRQQKPLVAIKRPHRHLTNDKTFLTMLVDEARLASSIDHPSVVKVRELGFDGGVPFIVMDYIEGASLAELRTELASMGRAVDARVALRIGLDALAGLHAAHELRDEGGRHLGIIHRDVSPHNVLIGCDGGTRLTDFGIAKAEDRVQVTRTHEVKGKLAYMAPERIDKRRVCTVQSDVFSMAVVIWECLAGRRLFRGEDAVDTLQEVMTAPIPSLRDMGVQISAELDDVIARALSRDLEPRFANAHDFAEALRRAAGPANIGTHEDVARLMEALFGTTIALRHEHVRAGVGQAELAELLARSGLPSRDHASLVPAPPSGKLLSSLAPPAPSARYSFNTKLPGATPGGPTVVKRVQARRSWGLAAGFVGAAVLGMLATTVFFPRRAAEAPSEPLPASAHVVPPEPPAAMTRRVIVPMPFPATHIEFDDTVRELSPPAEVAAFDVPTSSGPRHRVSALSLDGLRAEAFVREEDGVGHPEGDGFVMAIPSATSAPVDLDAPLAPRRPALGTVKDGFTKLR